MMDESEMDPSLPLNDDSLLLTKDNSPPRDPITAQMDSPILNIEPAQTVVRFQNVPHVIPSDDVQSSTKPRTDPPQTFNSSLTAVTGSADNSDVTDSTWQVDGSNHSIAGNSMQGDQMLRGLTMRDYEEQLKSLRKENFNLKLRIYFMEENKGLYHGPVEQENLYKINIDLKVKGEELKKELQENKLLVSEAAKGLQMMEEKHKQRTDALEQEIRQSQADKTEAVQRCADLESQINQLIVAREASGETAGGGEKVGISEESRLLYNEAFGSFANDSKFEDTPDKSRSDIVHLRLEVEDLTKELDRKIEENVELAKQNEESTKMLEIKEKEINKLQVDLKQAQSEESEEILASQTRISELESERDSNLTTIVIQKRQISGFQLQLQESESKHQLKIDESTQLVARLETELDQCNQVVSRLEAELKQRSQEVCTFLNLVKKLKRHPNFSAPEKTQETEDQVGLINNDFIDLEDISAQAEDIAAVISESREVLQEIIHNNASTRVISPEMEQHLEYEVNRNNELEQVLRSKEEVVEQLENSLAGKHEQLETMEKQLLDAEVEMNQARSRLEKKCAEIEAKDKEIAELKKQQQAKAQVPVLDTLNEKFAKLENRLRTSETNLKKSHICIQGFASENHRLSQKIKDLQARQDCLDSVEKCKSIKIGINKAKEEYQACLNVYRGRYDKLRSCLQTRGRVMDMMRERLEEITHFLSRLLESGDDTLNLSNIDTDLKDQIQNSIEQSMILTASLLNGSSILEEIDEIENDEVFDDEWVLPQVSLPMSLHSPQVDRRHSEGDVRVSSSRSNSLLSLPATLDTNQAKSEVPHGVAAPPDLVTSRPGSSQCLPRSLGGQQRGSLGGQQQPPAHVDRTNVLVATDGLGKEYTDLLVDLRDAMSKRREAEDALTLRTQELASRTQELDEVKLSLELALSQMNALKGAREDCEVEEFARPKTPLGFLEELPQSNFPLTPADNNKKSRIPVRTTQNQRSSSVPSRRRRTETGSSTETCKQQQSRDDGQIWDKLKERAGMPEPQHGVVSPAGSRQSGGGGGGVRKLRRSLSSSNRDRHALKADPQQVVARRLQHQVEPDDEEEYSEPDKEEARRRMGGIQLGDQESSSRRQIGARSDDEEAVNRLSKERLSGRELLRLDQEVCSLNNKVARLQDLNSNIEDANTNLQNEKTSLEERLSKTQQHLETARGHMTELMTEIKCLRLEAEQRSGSEVENQNRRNELELKFKTKMSELDGVRSELNQTKQKLTDAKQRLTALHSELEAEENKYYQEKRRHDETRINLETVTREMKVKVEEISRERDQARLRLVDTEQEVQQLNKEKEDVGRTLANLRGQVSLLEEKRLMNEALETEYNMIVRKNKTLESERSALKVKISQLERETSAVRASLADNLNRLKSEKTLLEKEHAERVARLEQECARHECAKSVAEDLCSEYKAKLNETRARSDSHQETVSRLTSEVTLKEKLLKNVESQLSGKEEKVLHLQEQLETAKSKEEKYRKKWTESENLMKAMKLKESEKENRAADGVNKVEDFSLRSKSIEAEGLFSSKSSSKYEFETVASQDSYRSVSRTGMAAKLGRRPLSTVSSNIMSNQNLFGPAATPELRMGKLGSADNQTPGGTSNTNLISGFCCRSQEELSWLQKEFDEMKLELFDCKEQLRSATEKISLSNRRKQKMEKAIVKELTKTRTVLKKAQTNLESCTSDS